jgi:hypothetical protein
VTKFQGSTVQQHEADIEHDHSLTLPAPPPSMRYQPVPTVRTPAPPLDPAESGLHRASWNRPPEELAESLDTTGRDTVPSPPPVGPEDDETTLDDEAPLAEL